MSFYIRLNKSVMTFDGLISAYVCFLKMAREQRGKGEGKEGVGNITDPQGGQARKLLVGFSAAQIHWPTSSIPPSSPADFFLNECHTLAWFLGRLCMTFSDLVSMCLSHLQWNLSRGSGRLSHKFKDASQMADVTERSGLLHLRAMALLNTQFPYLLPSISFNVSGEGDHVSHTSSPSRCRCPISHDLLSVHSQHSAAMSHGCRRPVLIKWCYGGTC